MDGVFRLLNGVYMDDTLRTLLILLVISTLIEVGVLIYFWNNSDMKECNWLWCTFGKTESITTIENSSIIIEQQFYHYRECYLNDVKVNCSDLI